MPKSAKKFKDSKQRSLAYYFGAVILVFVLMLLAAYIGMMSGQMKPSIGDHVKVALAQKNITISDSPQYEFDQALPESFYQGMLGGLEIEACAAGDYDISDYIGKTVRYTAYDASNAYADAASRIPLQVWVISEQDKMLCLFLTQRSGGAYISSSNPSLTSTNTNLSHN